MKSSSRVAVWLAVSAVVAFATTPAPYAAQCAVTQTLLQRAQSRPDAETLALETLERIALGGAPAISAGEAARLGVPVTDLHARGMEAVPTRACAIRAIGESATEAGLAFLHQLTSADLGPDDSGQLAVAVAIAVHESVLKRITGDAAQTEFLQNAAQEHSPAASWAVEELCDRGAAVSLPYIRQSIRTRNPTPAGEAEIRFCEDRIAALSRNPDRVKALGPELRATDDPAHDRLIGWAISQLASIGSKQADAELARFAAEVQLVPEWSPSKSLLQMRADQIRRILESRPK
jgi:hypothetical protein